MYKMEKFHDQPYSIYILLEGDITLDVINEAAKEFGTHVQNAGGKNFRVIVEFSNTSMMKDEVAQVFMDNQVMAVNYGMDRDAFVTSNPLIRTQMRTIAMKGGERTKKLGTLKFFDDPDSAKKYLLE